MGAIGVGQREGKVLVGVRPNAEGVPGAVVDRRGFGRELEAIGVGSGAGHPVKASPGEIIGEEDAIFREAPGLPGLEGRRALGPDRGGGKKNDQKNTEKWEFWREFPPKTFRPGTWDGLDSMNSVN